MLHLPGQFIAGVVSKEAQPDTFTDDKGTNLLDRGNDVEKRERPLDSVIPSSPIMSDYGEFFTIRWGAPGTPAAGATKLRLKGTVSVIVAKEKTAFEIKDGSLQKGIDLGFGTLKTAKSPFDSKFEQRVNLYLTYVGSRPVIPEVLLIDKNNKQIPRTLRPYLATGILQEKQFKATCLPEPLPDECTVRGSYFKTIEKIAVPFDIEVGLGF